MANRFHSHFAVKMLPNALDCIEDVLDAGSEKKHDSGPEGPEWRKQSIDYHLLRAAQHVLDYHDRKGGEPHLAHAATRLLMAVQLAYEAGDSKMVLEEGADEDRRQVR